MKITTEKQLRDSYEKVWFSSDMKEEEGYYRWIIEILGMQGNKCLLDVACGGGYLLAEANRKNLLAYGLDLSENALKKCKKQNIKAMVVQGSAESLPYRDDWCDYVACLGSLEHFLNPLKAIEEIKRVLKEDGKICIVLPNSCFEMLRGFLRAGLSSHKQEVETFYSLRKAKSLLKKGGLSIEQTWGYNPSYESIKNLQVFKRFNRLLVGAYKILRGFIPLYCSYTFVFICKKRFPDGSN